ncbi:MAG: choice-of-anchor J domain-containing protein, partial [Bacteroidia bacterium]|nr:choice-of-anchor J domain-containing protein [Bacteroidia bacterium]MDW8334695.1 choice-of-anchor J domain-containing protein [Bacteroidia bacterium]
MKKCIAAFAFAGLALWMQAAQCQNLLEATFDVPNQLPNGWTATPFVTSGWQGWRVGAADVLSSGYLPIPGTSGVIAVNDDKAGQNGNNSECLLTTPPVDLSNIDLAYLTFQLFYKDSEYNNMNPEVGQLWVSVDDGANYTLVENFEGNESQWQQKTINLNPYLGHSAVRFRFRYSDGGSWNDGMAIDNVRIFRPDSNEVELVSYNLQSVDYVGLGNRVVQATVRNKGSANLSNVTLSYSVNGGQPVVAVVNINPPLAFNQTRTVNHPGFWNINAPGRYDLSVEVSLPNGFNDPTPGDNTLSSSLVALSFIPQKKIV